MNKMTIKEAQENLDEILEKFEIEGEKSEHIYIQDNADADPIAVLIPAAYWKKLQMQLYIDNNPYRQK